METQVSTSSFIPFVGNLVTNNVTVTNIGPDPTSGVTVNIPLPDGLAFDSDDSSGAYNSATGIWTIGNLAVGGSATIDIISTVQPTGPYIFTAEVASSVTGDADSTPNNRLTNPNEDDTDSVTLVPRESNPMLNCNGPVSYTHLRSPRDQRGSRMPSSA